MTSGPLTDNSSLLWTVGDETPAPQRNSPKVERGNLLSVKRVPGVMLRFLVENAPQVLSLQDS